MIHLTRLDKSRVLVNLEGVKLVEATPDTVISFLNGDSLIVLESMEEIDKRVLEYRVRLLALTSSPTPP